MHSYLESANVSLEQSACVLGTGTVEVAVSICGRRVDSMTLAGSWIRHPQPISMTHAAENTPLSYPVIVWRAACFLQCDQEA
jgi:hypothetical protein